MPRNHKNSMGERKKNRRSNGKVARKAAQTRMRSPSR
jgi:hypothetical protein